MSKERREGGLIVGTFLVRVTIRDDGNARPASPHKPTAEEVERIVADALTGDGMTAYARAERTDR